MSGANLTADEYRALPIEEPPAGYSFRRILGTRTVHVTRAYPEDNYRPICGASLAPRMNDVAEFRRGGDRRCAPCFSMAGIYEGPKPAPAVDCGHDEGGTDPAACARCMTTEDAETLLDAKLRAEAEAERVDADEREADERCGR